MAGNLFHTLSGSSLQAVDKKFFDGKCLKFQTMSASGRLSAVLSLESIRVQAYLRNQIREP